MKVINALLLLTLLTIVTVFGEHSGNDIDDGTIIRVYNKYRSSLITLGTGSDSFNSQFVANEGGT